MQSQVDWTPLVSDPREPQPSWAKALLSRAGALPWPLLVAAAAVGVVLVGWSYRMSAAGAPAGGYYLTFWAGMLLAILPVSAKVAAPLTPRAQRIWGITLLGVLTAVPKYLRNPDQPLYHDEYAHWREAVDVLSTGQLLRPNALIPIVQFFPGTSAFTAAIERLTGLSVWHSGQLIVAVMHVLTLLAMFLLAEAHLRTSQAGAVAALVYAVNPSAVYFDTQYAYESVAMGLFAWVLALASLAGKASTRRHRVGFTVAALIAVAGCIVTHHLTTLFLLVVLGVVCVGITWRTRSRRRAARRAATEEAPAPMTSGIEGAVWWTVLAGTVVMAGLWLVFVASPTVSYLSPYFGGSVKQLATMAQTDGDSGGRKVLAATVQPLWERILTAGAPFVLGVFCLVGSYRLWLHRFPGPTATLALMTFGLIYFPSVPFVLAPSGAEGARRSWAFTYVGVALIVTLVALGRRPGRKPLVPPRWRTAVGMLLLAVLLIGNVGGGLNDPYRFPGPFRWGTDTNSASNEARTVARQLSAQAGTVRVVADGYTALQLVAYGGLEVAAPSTGFPAWELTQTPNDPPLELAKMLAGSEYDYLVVDIRMGEEAAFNGTNYGPGDPLEGQVTPMAYLTRLDHVPWASRVMATEHLRVYRLDLRRLGAVAQAGS